MEPECFGDEVETFCWDGIGTELLDEMKDALLVRVIGDADHGDLAFLMSDRTQQGHGWMILRVELGNKQNNQLIGGDLLGCHVARMI